MARIDYNKEKQFAQQELMRAGREFHSVKMRLEGTKYQSKCNDIWSRIQALNNALIADIRKEVK